MINVLSIDFDFFQDVDENTLVCNYPDGHDLTTEISRFVWSSHYANDKVYQKLMTVKTNKSALKFVQQILKQNADPTGAHCHTMIANSHRHLHDLINDVVTNHDEKINIYNMDMHHDMFDTKKKKHSNILTVTNLDCGNWASHIKNEYPNSKYIWIKNPISESLYPSKLPDKIWDDYTPIKDIKFDIIFLCRSDAFVPPHLDKDFTKLVRIFKIYYGNTLIEKSVEKSRSINKYTKAIKEAMEKAINYP